MDKHHKTPSPTAPKPYPSPERKRTPQLIVGPLLLKPVIDLPNVFPKLDHPVEYQ